MADPRFFHKAKTLTISDIIDITGCDVADHVDTSTNFLDVAALSTATDKEISFLDNIKYKNDFAETKAGACFVSPKFVDLAPKNLICLISKSPYKAYALTAQVFYPEKKPETKISTSAHIPASATVGDGATIGENVYIGENVKIGKNAWIEPNAVIENSVIIGDHCHIGSNTTVSHSIIGDHVRLYPGVKVGQDGFGFAIDLAGHVKVPQLGRVIIEDHVQIGSNTTIDRGAGPDTVIGQGTWIDNLVQIGHNVVIGRGCIIVAHVGISGSTVIEDFVAIGGQVGIAGHLRIGAGARIGAQAGVMNNLEGGKEYMGSPAFEKAHFFRQVAALNRLIKRKKSD